MSSNKNIKGEKYLHEIIGSLDYLNRKGRKKAINRGKGLIDILEKISKFKSEINALEDLARQEFRHAIQQYILGFYGNSILHTFFSIEMGLLIRLERKLTNEEKEICQLIELGYQYVCDYNNNKIFRKLK